MSEADNLPPSLPVTDAPHPSGSGAKAGCRKKCGGLLLMILLLGGAAVALHFCPWFLRTHMNGSAAVTDLTPLQSKVAALSTEVETLQTQVHDLNDRVAALANAAPATPTPAAETAAPAPAAPAPAGASAADLARLQNDYVALSTAINALQTQIKQNGADAASARDATQATLAAVIAFIQVRDEALAGHGFADLLTALRDAVRGENGFTDLLAKLESHAAKGAPTAGQLRAALIDREAAAIAATEKAHAATWWQQLLVQLKSLVSVRPLNGGGQEGVYAAMETALANGDAADAAERFAALPTEAQKTLSDWRAQLDARRDIDAALVGLAARFTAPSGATVNVPASPPAAPAPAPASETP